MQERYLCVIELLIYISIKTLVLHKCHISARDSPGCFELAVCLPASLHLDFLRLVF